MLGQNEHLKFARESNLVWSNEVLLQHLKLIVVFNTLRKYIRLFFIYNEIGTVSQEWVERSIWVVWLRVISWQWIYLRLQ